MAAGARDKQGNREYATINHTQSMQQETMYRVCNKKSYTEYATRNHVHGTKHRVCNKKSYTEYATRNQTQSIQ